MCGLAGIIDHRGPPRSGDLRRMAAALEHRGPDWQGVYVAGPVGLAHRRLSILDLSERARQPMHSADGRLTVIYNGEIYNWRELAQGLRDRRPFRTQCDTEVLLRCYEERGAPCVRDFNGMFAFAVLDERAGEVVLARDPWGIKPLYYAPCGDRFYFASEIKAILAAGFRSTPHQMAVLDHVFTAWTGDERTLFQGISRVPAGCLLRYRLAERTFTVERYFRAAPDWESAERLGGSHERWVEAVDGALTRAVREQLVSDVPVGTFCSGGLDSSLVTAVAARHRPGVQAFNVTCPDDPDVDEGPFARRLAESVGIELHQLTLTRESFREALVRTVHHQEMPLMVVNAVAMHLVSALARSKGVNVLLTGEGADEIFGGYVDLYRRTALARMIRAHGPLVGGLLARVVRCVESLARRMGMSNGDGCAVGAHELLTDGLRVSASRRAAEPVYDRYTDPLDRALAAQLHSQLETYLPALLHRADRASMGASVELRVPYLDLHLASLALAVPPAFKVGVSGLRPYGKRILKEVATRHIPASLAYRPKMGFTIPPGYYLGAWPRAWVRDGFVAGEFEVRPADLDTWVREQTYQSACWMLTLEIWGQLFFRGRGVDEVAEEFVACREAPAALRSPQPGRAAQPRGAQREPRARLFPGLGTGAPVNEKSRPGIRPENAAILPTAALDHSGSPAKGATRHDADAPAWGGRLGGRELEERGPAAEALGAYAELNPAIAAFADCAGELLSGLKLAPVLADAALALAACC